MFGDEDGVGDRVQPAAEVAIPVDGGRFGEPAAGKLLLEPVIGVLGGQAVSEPLGVAGEVLEAAARDDVVDEKRGQLDPGVVVAFPVGVGDGFDVIEADDAVGQRVGERGELGHEPGQAGHAGRGALPEATVVLEPADRAGVTLAAVLAPTRERPHRRQQRRVGLVAGPAERFDALAHHHRRQVPPRDLGRQSTGVAEVVDLSGHGPSPYGQEADIG